MKEHQYSKLYRDLKFKKMKPTKEYNGRSRIRMFNADCMKFMGNCDKYDLAIVDPPYGIGASGQMGGANYDRWRNPKLTEYHDGDWDNEKPNKEYFNHIFDISKDQIIWGGNHFELPPTRGIICWDKVRSGNYSEFELAWTSFDVTSKIFKWLWNGFQKQKPEKRIHPTQKPVQLYKWLLINYAKEGDTILDTHGGSFSIAIACWDLGFDLDICELDTDYFNDAVKRFENHIAQAQLF